MTHPAQVLAADGVLGVDAPLRTAIDVLGVENVDVQEPSNNGMFRSRQSVATLRPTTQNDLVRLVTELSAIPSSPPIYPVSTGRNWGFGSALPVREGAFVLRLDRLAAIRSLDLAAGVAVVEPGVSQQQLATALAGAAFMPNLTMSSASTSLLGNTVDRGVGVWGQRADDVVGVEVLLADGSTVQIGYSGGSAPYRHGVGPSLLPAFQQSNLGIVTAIALRLVRRPEVAELVRLRFAARHREAAIDLLHEIHASGLAAGVIKVYSSGATSSYGGVAADGYTAYVCCSGIRQVVDAAVDVVRGKVRRSGSVDECAVLSPDNLGSDLGENALLRSFVGDPGHNDAMVEAVFGASAESADVSSTHGWLFCTPVVPFSADALAQACEIATSVTTDSTTVGHTTNVLPDGWVDFVVSIRFPRTTAAAESAHRVLDSLHHRFLDAGFPPYRLDIDHMALAPAVRGSERYERLLHDLKHLVDPAGLLAPGRYL